MVKEDEEQDRDESVRYPTQRHVTTGGRDVMMPRYGKRRRE